MFGEMNAIPIADLKYAPDEVGGSLEGAVARLLEVTDHPAVARWIQFPKALLLFLVVPGDPESGAFYIYDRCSREWFWIDFEDEKFGGYNLSDFDRLVRDCRFLDLVECPQHLAERTPWVLQAGSRPQQAPRKALAMIQEPAEARIGPRPGSIHPLVRPFHPNA